jgi:hypothetical protein
VCVTAKWIWKRGLHRELLDPLRSLRGSNPDPALLFDIVNTAPGRSRANAQGLPISGAPIGQASMTNAIHRLPVDAVEPDYSSLSDHPYSNLMPMMSEEERARPLPAATATAL